MEMISLNLAKVSANGQITLPVDVRRRMGIKSGDKVLLLEKADGELVLRSASNQALEAMLEAQAALAGVAEEMGLRTEEDVQALVDEVRHGRKQ